MLSMILRSRYLKIHTEEMKQTNIVSYKIISFERNKRVYLIKHALLFELTRICLFITNK